VSGRLLIQRSTTECGVSVCVREASQWEAITQNRVETQQKKSYKTEGLPLCHCVAVLVTGSYRLDWTAAEIRESYRTSDTMTQLILPSSLTENRHIQ